MAERTGTLWENVDDRASCNHGFASHICFTLYRDILGAYEIDPVSRELHLRFTDVGLEWCEGTIPVRHGVIGVSWRRGGQTLRYQALTPAGWSVEVENLSGLELVRER